MDPRFTVAVELGMVLAIVLGGLRRTEVEGTFLAIDFTYKKNHYENQTCYNILLESAVGIFH